jgi:PAS domain S-box-containing protein
VSATSTSRSPRRPTPPTRAEGEADLRGSEERFRTLAESAPDAIVTARRDGLISYVNAATEALFGRSRAELVGQPLTILMPERHRAAHTAALARATSEGELSIVGTLRELVGEHRDGHEIPLEASFGLWRAGAELGFSGILRDITERHQQEQAEALVRQALLATSGAADLGAAVEALASALTEAVALDRVSYVVRVHGDVFDVAAVWGPESSRLAPGSELHINSPERLAATQREGYIVRQDTHDQGDDPLPLDGLDAQVAEHGIRSYVSVSVMAGGQLSALVNASSLTPGGFDQRTGALVARVVQAVSGTLHATELLQRERAVSDRLRDLDQMKNDFVGMVAHDLRTPLTVIAGFADLLGAQGDRFTDSERQQHLETVSRNARQLSDLVDDILHVVRLESGVVVQEVEPTDLGPVITQAVAEARVAHPDHTFTLAVPDGLPPALVDGERQGQVLGNLLTNAAKFADPATPIEVRVADEDDLLRVSVQDHGPGIRPDDVPKLFQRFSRIRPAGTASPVKGTGLGLYICRLLVESLGGTIEVETEPGAGSTFSYTVPVATAERQRAV